MSMYFFMFIFLQIPKYDLIPIVSVSCLAVFLF